MSEQRENSPAEDPYELRLYRVQYEEARALYEEGRFPECFQAAVYNLTDPTLPPYYQIRNNLLAAHAASDWDHAENYVYAAKRHYTNMLPVVQKHQDENDLAAMEEIRVELEDLDRYRDGDYASYDEDSEMDDEELEIETQFEDAAEVARVENQDKVDAENLRLPIRSSTEANTTPTINVVAPANEAPIPHEPTKKLRNKKSVKFNKGGAANAHAFTRSLGRNSGAALLRDLARED